MSNVSCHPLPPQADPVNYLLRTTDPVTASPNSKGNILSFSGEIRPEHLPGAKPTEWLFLLWAKIGRAAADRFEDRHPLPCHCIDVGKSAALLYEHVLGKGLRKRLAAAFEVDQDAHLLRWMAFWAACHDLGKAAPGFQSKREDAIPPLTTVGFDFCRKDDHPHQFISSCVLADELTRPSPRRPALETKLTQRVAIAIGGHHGLFPSTAQWHDLPEAQLGCGHLWGTARRALLDELASVFGVSECPAPRAPGGPDAHWPMMVLAGLVAVADWIGSNKVYFPHSSNASEPATYAKTAEENARRALQQLGWLGWLPEESGDKSFRDLFGFTPRPLQEAAIQAGGGLDGPALVLIEAPMGEGKTEAAVYLADRWTHGAGGQGMYVAMPTMATGNQMFGRVRSFLARRYPTDVVNLQLLHSAAMLSKEFSGMQREAERRRQAFEPSDVYGPDARERALAPESGAVVAQSWFASNKKQAILAPFGVGTVDQALLSVLQVRHGFVRLFGLAGKTVILDEVHAYDTYMSTLLARTLEWLRALGCSVVLLSATLPPDKRRALVKAWTGRETSADATPYPRLTVAAGDAMQTLGFNADPARHITISLAWRDEQGLAGDLEAALAGGGCAAVIRNTVKDAQCTFARLRDALRPKGFDVRLFHARFLFDDRQRIEREVLGCFGKGPDGSPANPMRPAKAVLVATQVIEQSLDLDFDLMVSDVAPVDLVLQRAGRLHRHDRPERPVKTPTLWLLKPEQFDGVPNFGAGNEKVYDRHILLRSFHSLRWQDALPRLTLDLPDRIDDLVRRVYSDDPYAPPDDAWRASLTESKVEMLREQEENALAAKQFCIVEPATTDRFVLNSRDLDDENPERPPEQQAVTRLAEPSVQTVFLPKGSNWHQRSKAPSLDEARGLLGRAVTIQDKRVCGHLLRTAVPVGWRDSALLRHCRLVELDDSAAGSAGAWALRVDSEMGLLIEAGTRT